MIATDNIYTCGCVASNVPILTRCEAHNGFVVAIVPKVKINKPKAYKLDGFRLIYGDLNKTVRSMKDNFIDLIISYPQHDPFYIRSNLTSSGSCRFGDKDIFKQYKRILSEAGCMFLIVEYSVLAEALVSATFAGFEIRQIVNTYSNIIREHLTFASKQSKKEQNSWTVCRAGVLLSKKGAAVPYLPDEVYLEKNADDLLNMFQLNSSARVLDGSCIHFPFLVSALRANHIVIGITENENRFASIVNYLKRH